MSVAGLTSLSELISNQLLEQGQSAPVAPPAAQPKTFVTPALPADTFTPSTQNESAEASAQDAGLFQVTQLALSSATAGILSVQTTVPQASQNAVPAQAVQATVSDTAAAEGALTTTSNVQTAAPPTAAVATPLPTLSPAPAATAPGSVLNEPQALNTALLGLGLSNSDILFIDRLASQNNNFNPTVYGDLVQQFQAQAAQNSAIATGENATALPEKAAGT